MKKLLTSLTGSLVAVALITSCSPATQQPTSSDSAAASSASGIRIVKDSGGKDVEIPADVTRVAPTIGAFSAVTAMLGASGKITAAATSALSPRFKATYPDYEKANPKGFDTKNVEDIIASGAQVVYGPDNVNEEQQAPAQRSRNRLCHYRQIGHGRGDVSGLHHHRHILGGEHPKESGRAGQALPGERRGHGENALPP